MKRRPRKAGIGNWGLFFSILLLTASAFARIDLQITHIGEAQVTDSEIWVNEEEDIAGNILFNGTDNTESLLQLAWRRVGDDTWWIHKQTMIFNNPPPKILEWKFLDVPLGSEFDYKKGLELVAFLVGKDKPLPEGIIDYHSLLYLSKAVSNQVTLIRNPKNPSLLLVTPRIRIDKIAGQPFRPGAVHEAGLQAILYGEARKPTASLIRVVVQPLSSDEYWVIDNEPLIRQGSWSAKVDFTEYGFDEESEFIVFAVITREELPRGRGIPLNEWRAYLQNQIISATPTVRVTRVDIPLAKNQAGVRILSVDNFSVDSNSRQEVKSRCGMKGMLLGRPLSKDEAVWLLVTEEYGNNQWRVLGKASLKNGRYWELSPQVLGGSGEYLRILAVIAKDRVESLNKEDIEENIAFSRPVHIITQDQPALRVDIKTIDKQAVQTAAEMQVYQVSEIEGEVSGRPLEKDDKVWILKMDANEKDSWKLLGRASLNSKHHWTLPPLTLGNSGDELILIAVVSQNEISNLDLAEQGDVLATSQRVHVRLKN